ncbi:MAG: hypothetical protein HEP70_11745 [Rhodobiaceae bacterium]|nr:hypothetical protein [Rhodobiaceae bacterium]
MSDKETATVLRRMRSLKRGPRATRALGICLTSMLILSSCGEEKPDANALGLNAASDTSLITGSVKGLQRRGVFIQLPAGLPDELASQLLARFQEASIANQLTLARTGTVPEYTVKGVVRAGAARNGTAVVVVWEVIGPDGKRVKRMTDDVVIQRRNSADPAFYDPWAVVDEATLEEIADTAALELAGWVSDQTLGASPDSDVLLTTASIGDQEPTDTQGTPATDTSPSVDLSTPSLLQTRQPAATPPDISGIAARNATLGIAPPVAAPPPQTVEKPSPEPADREETGTAIATLEPLNPNQGSGGAPQSITSSTRILFDVAVGTSPGDGRLSLAAAVQEALVKADHKTNEPRAFRVIGNVALEPVQGTSPPGTISVNIEWTVTTKEGTPLGLITQSNQVDENALAGAWGDIAVAAGTAAADGILQLINEPTPPA